MKKIDTDRVLKQQAAEQAMPPETPKTFIAEAIRDAQKARETPVAELEKQIEKENKALMDLYETEQWQVLKKRIEQKKQYVRNALREKVRSSDIRAEDIGFRYLIADQVEGALDSVIAIVEDLARMAKTPQEEEI